MGELVIAKDSMTALGKLMLDSYQEEVIDTAKQLLAIWTPDQVAKFLWATSHVMDVVAR